MRELARKCIHLVFGLGCIGVILLLDHTSALAVLACGLFLGLVLIDLVLRGCTIPVISATLDYVDRRDPVPGRGALFFVASALVCVILFPTGVVVPALVSLAVLDGVATIAGTRFGRTHIYKKKTAEGTAAGIIAAFLVLALVVSVPGALIIAIIAGIIEMFSPVDDNLVIPVCICVLLSLVPALL